MPALTKKARGVSRIDSGATHGWFVRIYRKGKTHSKFFSDLKNKGKARALRLALAYWKQLRAEVGPPGARAYRVMVRNRNNKTGVIGVARIQRKSVGGDITHFFTVTWRPKPNQPRNRSFSISLWGEEKAFEMAVKFRREQERDIRKKARLHKIA